MISFIYIKITVKELEDSTVYRIFIYLIIFLASAIIIKLLLHSIAINTGMQKLYSFFLQANLAIEGQGR